MKSIGSYINLDNLTSGLANFGKEGPIDHTVIDDFFVPEIALALEKQFPAYTSNVWHEYNNPIEIKRTLNDWNAFPPLTYSIFSLLNSRDFLEILEEFIKVDGGLFADNGLNGGGWHIHAKGGKLNTHLDYSLHPKLGLQRKLNIIVYLNSAWQAEWGGALGFWGNESNSEPGDLVKEVIPQFNRAVLFDTTQNSWHGLPNPLTCPEGECRRSLAAYFLCAAPVGTDNRGKALFAPTEDQKGQTELMELIKKRADVGAASDVYRA